jgi:predicted RNA polymerase sigma factor
MAEIISSMRDSNCGIVDAVDAYQTALQLDPGPAERAFIQRRLTQINSG